MARFDSLTGLANRAYFHELVSDYVSVGDPSRHVGLVVFDLDDFKSVNDTLGHPVGDGLIYAAAERLSGFASEDVKVSRFGGDEFMIFFNDVKDRESFSAPSTPSSTACAARWTWPGMRCASRPAPARFSCRPGTPRWTR